MGNLRLATQLGLSTLRSRPTLTILAVFLLAAGTALISGVWGSVFILGTLQSKFMSAMSVELELTSDTEAARAAVMPRVESWPDVLSVQYVPPDQVLREIEHETGENLTQLFSTNPFPPIIRVHFEHIRPQRLDSLSAAARQWSEVSSVVYPRRLWNDLQRLSAQFRGGLNVAAILCLLALLGAVGLCLRAQIRNRAATWEFLELLGMSRRTLSLALFVQQMVIGLASGIIACVLLWLLLTAYGWLLLLDTNLPLWFYAVVCIASVLLAMLSGLLSPRRFSV